MCTYFPFPLKTWIPNDSGRVIGVSVGRISTLKTISTFVDPTFRNANVFLWSSWETIAAHICAAGPAINSLFGIARSAIKTHSSNSKYNRTYGNPNGSGGQEQTPPDPVSKPPTNTTTCITELSELGRSTSLRNAHRTQAPFSGSTMPPSSTDTYAIARPAPLIRTSSNPAIHHHNSLRTSIPPRFDGLRYNPPENRLSISLGHSHDGINRQNSPFNFGFDPDDTAPSSSHKKPTHHKSRIHNPETSYVNSDSGLTTSTIQPEHDRDRERDRKPQSQPRRPDPMTTSSGPNDPSRPSTSSSSSVSSIHSNSLSTQSIHASIWTTTQLPPRLHEHSFLHTRDSSWE